MPSEVQQHCSRLIVVLVFAAALCAAPASASAAGPSAVAAGFYQSCAIRADGSVPCWGAGTSGAGAVPSGLGAATQLATSDYATCILQAGGLPACWGDNPYHSGNTSVPAGLGAVKQISPGQRHTCVVRLDDTPYCWGENSSGQLTPPAGIGTVTATAAGAFHTCAIKTDGTPVCWGGDFGGQTDVPAGIGAVTQIAAGYAYTCAKKADGTAACWGHTNCFGCSYNPAAVPANLGQIKQISAGQEEACAIKADNTLACWGQILTGIPAGLGAVTRVSAGVFQVCALKASGGIACWGNNQNGTVGTAPAFANGTPPHAGSGAYAFTFNAPASPAVTGYSVSAGALPPGLALDAGNGQLSGTPTTAGVYTFTVTATDGVFSDAAQEYTIAVDRTAPVTIDDLPSAYTNTDQPVHLNATDAGGAGVAKTYYTAGANPVDPTTSSTVYTAASPPVLHNDGDRIKYFSVDGAGNAEAVRTSAPVHIDRATPTVGDDVPSSYRNSDVAVHINAGDTGGSGVKAVYYTAGTSPAAPTTASAVYDPANPPVLHNDNDAIRYFVTDTAGNQSAPRTATVKIDRAAPTATANVPDTYTDGSVTVTLSATDTGGSGVSGLYYTAGSKPADPTVNSSLYDPGHPIVLLNNGDRVKFFATDAAGNSELVVISAPALIDQTPPLTAADVPTGYVSHAWTVTLSASDANGSGVDRTYYTAGAQPPAPTAASAVYDPQNPPVLAHDGDQIRYFSVDRIGHQEAVRTSAPLALDTDAPVISLGAPADGATYAQGATALAGYTCTDLAGGSGVASCSAPVASGSPIDTQQPGAHSFAVVARDAAGNTTARTVNYTVIAPPAIAPTPTTPTITPAALKPDFGAAVSTALGRAVGLLNGKRVPAKRTATLTLTSPAAGRWSGQVLTTGKPTELASGARATSAPGATRLTLTFNRKAATLLRKTHRLKVVVRIVFTPAGGAATTRSKTIMLRS